MYRLLIAFICYTGLCLAAQVQPAPKQKPGSAAPAQNQPAPKQSQPTPKPKAKAVNPLDRLAGTWQASSFMIGGGSLTFGSGSGTTVKRPDSDTVSFTMSRSETRWREIFGLGRSVPETVTYRQEFTLKYAGEPGKYLLTVKADQGLSFEDFPLTYSQKDGFTGDGPVKAGEKTVKITARITMEKDGGHMWSVFPGVDPDVKEAGPEAKEAKEKPGALPPIYQITFHKEKKDDKEKKDEAAQPKP